MFPAYSPRGTSVAYVNVIFGSRYCILIKGNSASRALLLFCSVVDQSESEVYQIALQFVGSYILLFALLGYSLWVWVHSTPTHHELPNWAHIEYYRAVG